MKGHSSAVRIRECPIFATREEAPRSIPEADGVSSENMPLFPFHSRPGSGGMLLGRSPDKCGVRDNKSKSLLDFPKRKRFGIACRPKVCRAFSAPTRWNRSTGYPPRCRLSEGPICDAKCAVCLLIFIDKETSASIQRKGPGHCGSYIGS
jgi:hypothetical protein